MLDPVAISTEAIRENDMASISNLKRNVGLKPSSNMKVNRAAIGLRPYKSTSPHRTLSTASPEPPPNIPESPLPRRAAADLIFGGAFESSMGELHICIPPVNISGCGMQS